MPLTQEELIKLNSIYKSICGNIVYTLEQAKRYDNRNCTLIIFKSDFSGKTSKYRQTAAWRIEAHLGRRLLTGNTKCSESVDHIDGDSLNE